uniref:phosphomevalonate kinase n=1 Tax=Pseudo-nitzschia australis TaxID=44445 RepID=A0A7S4A8Z6_9STRA
MTSTTSDIPGVTVSAPGKILLAGGYLVLEAPNAGFVVAADKRFYTSVNAGNDDNSNDDGDEIKQPMRIRVESPQFHSTWNYTYEAPNCHLVPSPNNESVNPFVEKSLRVCLIYLLQSSKLTASTGDTASPSSLEILIRADNDFYSVLPHLSEDSKKTPAEVAALPKFLPCPIDPDTGKVVVHKTGLGSSAALTTSLVGALVHYFLRSSQERKEEHLSGIIHNLAQICHCHAQGKVGSGFDVSAACHGTHVYRRFPKCLLPDLLQLLDRFEINENAKDQPVLLGETLKKLVELVPWKEDMVAPLNLPNDLQLILADVRGGSESPSMARTVLKWKAAEKNTDNNEVPYWSPLSRLNPKIVEAIQLLAKEGTDNVDYDSLSKLPSSDWSTDSDSPLVSLRDTFLNIRKELRSMGEAADVPIEPPPQQELCDATSKLPGVVTALVPGAGGYDAVACLYINRPEVVRSIGELWSSWKSPVVCPLAVRAGDEGLRLEK